MNKSLGGFLALEKRKGPGRHHLVASEHVCDRGLSLLEVRM